MTLWLAYRFILLTIFCIIPKLAAFYSHCFKVKGLFVNKFKITFIKENGTLQFLRAECLHVCRKHAIQFGLLLKAKSSDWNIIRIPKSSTRRNIRIQSSTLDK